MLNFNNERMSMAVTACRMSRCCLEDAIRQGLEPKLAFSGQGSIVFVVFRKTIWKLASAGRSSSLLLTRAVQRGSEAVQVADVPSPRREDYGVGSVQPLRVFRLEPIC